MVIALIFVESQYCLPNSNNILVDMEFTNARQLVLVNNRSNVQNWIKTLYDKAGQCGTKLAYHKLDLAFLWFINTIGYCH